MIFVEKSLLVDMKHGIDWALRDIPDECNCEAYTETDTNATIHQEDKCQIFTRYHLEAVASDIEKYLAVEHQRALDALLPCGHEKVYEAIRISDGAKVCGMCEAAKRQ